MREADIQKACLDFLELQGVFAWRNNTTGVYDPVRKTFRSFHGMKGVADILAVLEPHGIFWAIEVKTPKGKLSEHQKTFLQKVDDAGAYASVVRSVDDLERDLATIRREAA